MKSFSRMSVKIAGIKVAVAQMACRVIDRAIQIHGGMGVCQDSPLAHWFAGARRLEIKCQFTVDKLTPINCASSVPPVIACASPTDLT